MTQIDRSIGIQARPEAVSKEVLAKLSLDYDCPADSSDDLLDRLLEPRERETMSTTDSPPPIDAGQLLVSDHRELDRVFARLEAPGGGGADRAELIGKVVRDLSVHSAIEEIVLYPAARTELDDGDEVADQALAEGRAIKEMLVRLERLDTTRPDVDEILARLVVTVRAHVAEEEGPDGMIERLRAALGDYRLAEMGRSLAEAKRVVPTHPHPHAPDRPPGNVIAGPAARLLDNLRDAAKDD